MANNNDAGQMIIAPERTVERGRGCWNCKSFANGELAQKRWTERRKSDIATLIAQGIVPLTREGDHENTQITKQKDARFEMMDKLIHAGTAGLCMHGKVDTDFVHCQYLCTGWNGRDGHSLATSGRPLDKLPDELMDIAEGKAKKA